MCSAQPSVSTYRELRQRGDSRGDIDRAMRLGLLQRVRRGVYATAGACEEVVAAAAHGGAPACVTAARHLGLWVLPDDGRLHVWMGADGHRRHPEPCDCVEHWDAGDRTGFAPLSVVRILRQILGCHGVEAFFVALESARRQGLLGRAALRRLGHRVSGEGREAIALSRDDADSGLESLLRWRLRAFGLPVRTQVAVYGVGRVDVLIGERLLIETDGRENHHEAPRRHKDLVRDAHAAVWGYTTLRFDYALVIHDWELVEAAILGALAAQSASA